MSAKMTITFLPDGNARCLYGEEIDLSSLGSLTIERASRIEFDAASQTWEVTDAQGVFLYRHKSRQNCLAWEKANLA